MNPSKNKILVWAVILLMIANVALLATIWLTHNKQRPARGTPADYLIKELGLNSEQQNKLKTLAREHHEQAEKIKSKIKNAREKFFSLLHESLNTDQRKNIDSSRSVFLSEIATNLQELELLTFNHFQQVRSICTPDQQKKFDDIIEDVLRMIAAGPPGRGPGGGERMPPPGDHLPPPEN